MSDDIVDARDMLANIFKDNQRLRAEIERLWAQSWKVDAEVLSMREEIERLRAELGEIIRLSDDYDCAVKIARAALKENK